MRVEANVTSGLLATDSSAVELVPLLQAEVRKLREMLTLQRMPVERERDFLESRVVEEMRKRVSELETQLAEREKLINSLDLMRREELLEEEEELERMFLINGEGRDFRTENPYNLYKNDVKYNNYNNDYDMNYNTYTNSDHKNHHNDINDINDNNNNYYNNNNNNNHHNSNSNISIVHDSSDSRNDNRYKNIQNGNNISHKQYSINSTIHDRNSWDSGRNIQDNSRTLGPGSPSKSKSNNSYQTISHSNNHNHSNDYNNNRNDSHNKSYIEGQSCSVRSILTARDRGHGHETDSKMTQNMSKFNDALSDPPPPPPLSTFTPTLTPISTSTSASTSASAGVARSQPVVLLSEDAVDVSHPRVINLNQVRKFIFPFTIFVLRFTNHS